MRLLRKCTFVVRFARIKLPAVQPSQYAIIPNLCLIFLSVEEDYANCVVRWDITSLGRLVFW